jgi:hypothetical protein
MLAPNNHPLKKIWVNYEHPNICYTNAANFPQIQGRDVELCLNGPTTPQLIKAGLHFGEKCKTLHLRGITINSIKPSKAEMGTGRREDYYPLSGFAHLKVLYLPKAVKKYIRYADLHLPQGCEILQINDPHSVVTLKDLPNNPNPIEIKLLANTGSTIIDVMELYIKYPTLFNVQYGGLFSEPERKTLYNQSAIHRGLPGWIVYNNKS